MIDLYPPKECFRNYLFIVEDIMYKICCLVLYSVFFFFFNWVKGYWEQTL